MKASAQERYLRLVNYLAAAQVYLKDNVLLEKPLRPEHIKDRLLGHWGTCPGINFIYLHLNQLIQRTNANMLLLTGPGHGAAANLANMHIEGTLTQFYPELTRDRAGLHRFVRAFSRPGGFPSHLNPALPGVIHEGGELGYALATAYGAVLDNQPFGPTLDTLPLHHADVPVTRKLVYIEPAPEHPERRAGGAGQPDFVQNAWLSLSTLPRYEPIREHLQRVLERNRLVERTRCKFASDGGRTPLARFHDCSGPMGQQLAGVFSRRRGWSGSFGLPPSHAD